MKKGKNSGRDIELKYSLLYDESKKVTIYDLKEYEAKEMIDLNSTTEYY